MISKPSNSSLCCWLMHGICYQSGPEKQARHLSWGVWWGRGKTLGRSRGGVGGERSPHLLAQNTHTSPPHPDLIPLSLKLDHPYTNTLHIGDSQRFDISLPIDLFSLDEWGHSIMLCQINPSIHMLCPQSHLIWPQQIILASHLLGSLELDLYFQCDWYFIISKE